LGGWAAADVAGDRKEGRGVTWAEVFAAAAVGGAAGALILWLLLSFCRAAGDADEYAEAYEAGYAAGYDAGEAAEVGRRAGGPAGRGGRRPDDGAIPEVRGVPGDERRC